MNKALPIPTRSAAARRNVQQATTPPLSASRVATSPSLRSPPESDSLPVSPSSSPQDERPIRPLPKTRLRDRLSVEQVENIIFPTVPEHQPLFSVPLPTKESNNSVSSGPSQSGLDGNQAAAMHREWSEAERILEIEAYARSQSQSQLWRDTEKPLKKATSQMHRSPRFVSHAKGKPSQSSLGGESVISFTDGDEGFENTNNKKKRKIPQSNGSFSMNHASLVSEMAATHITPSRQDNLSPAGAVDSTTISRSGTYYGSGTAVSPSSAAHMVPQRQHMPLSQITPNRVRRPGSGRGSLDRRQAGNGYGKEMNTARRNASNKAINSQLNSPPPSQGIISSAIANAQSQEPSSPAQAADGVSLLEQETAQKASERSGNFTFTCESATSNQLVWSAPTGMAGTGPEPAYPMPPTQMPDGSRRGGHAPPGPEYVQPQHPQGDQQLPPRKPRPRKPGRIYDLAAKQRRLNQAWTNSQHPPKPEDVWICQFCEYEAIFGKPPMALIRQYEIKDRKAQKALAERRRMLEKVKQKGRKNKKNAKASHKSLAHQAAEFQKREFLRNTGGLPGNPRIDGQPLRDGDLYHPDELDYDDEYYDDDRHVLADEGEDYDPIDDDQYYESDEFDENEVPPLLPPDQQHQQHKQQHYHHHHHQHPHAHPQPPPQSIAGPSSGSRAAAQQQAQLAQQYAMDRQLAR